MKDKAMKVLEILKSRAITVAHFPGHEKHPDIHITVTDEDEEYETIREWLKTQ